MESQRTATRESLGMAVFSSSSHFPLISAWSRNVPVMFPPGLAKEASKPAATGSAFEIAGDNGDRCRRSLRSLDGSRPQGDDHVDAETDQFGSELWESIGLPSAKR